MMYERDEFDFCKRMLTQGEYVIWKGKPEKGRLFSRNDIVMIPFSLVWCGFAVFWFVSALSMGAPIPFAMFGIPFICVGLYLVFGRFIHTAHRRKKTLYVITNKKIIRNYGGRIDMLEIASLPPMRVEAFGDGCGNIYFGEVIYTGYTTSRRRRATSTEHVFALENIPDVVRVQDMIASIGN
ncbi:MAG: hypothetical protein IJ046_01175 [Clostridia bacterium]|nr:hypothetical protein [Clostridia bacterium]